MRAFPTAILTAALSAGLAIPQNAPQPGRGAPAPVPGGRGGPSAVAKKHILVIGATGGFHHGSTSEGMAAFWKMGRDSQVWDTEIKTDFSWITRKQPGSEAHSLPFFDAVVFVNTTGSFGLNDEQKEALLSFVRDDGKGIVLAHAALDSNYDWPEWAEMAGGWFEAHPFNTLEAPIIVEDQTFPATRHFAKYIRIHDEMYSPKNWSRDKVNVLMRMNESKLDFASRPRTRPDKDQALAWAKMYGKGRVFYATFGHTKEAWDNPDIIRMYTEAVKWAVGLTDGSTDSHPKVN
jgi:type 1 glutamine amidotransferase